VALLHFGNLLIDLGGWTIEPGLRLCQAGELAVHRPEPLPTLDKLLL
jgi:hypothetical protein